MTAVEESTHDHSFIMDEDSMEAICLTFDLAFFNWSRYQDLDEFGAALRADFQINGMADQAVLAPSLIFHDDILLKPSHLSYLIQVGCIEEAHH